MQPKHRAPSRRIRLPWRPIAVSAAALALVAGASSWFLTGATAQSSINPLDLAQAQGANCQVLLAHATSTAQATRAKQCINDQNVIASALSPTSSPSGTPSSTATPPPTVSPTPTPTATSPSPSPTTTSPSPTPTATSPSPTPSSTATGCIALPSACGFPDATNTGASGTLTARSGDVTLGTAGQVFQNVDLAGCILVTAPNVVIRNVKVSCTGFYVIDVTSNSATASATIQDVTVDCGTNVGGTGIGEHNLIVQRVNVSHCVNGWDVDANTTITDSYCHDLTDEVQYPDAHTDCVQGIMTTAVTIHHNTLLAGHFSTSAVGGGVAGTNWVVDDNLLDGGAAAVYCNGGTAGVGSVVSNNRFGSNGWNYPNYAFFCAQPNVAWSGNVRDATGASLPVE